MEIKVRFNLGQLVFLKTDNEQLPRIVTEIKLKGGDMFSYIILYELSQETSISEHYVSEISEEKDNIIKLGI